MTRWQQQEQFYQHLGTLACHLDALGSTMTVRELRTVVAVWGRVYSTRTLRGLCRALSTGYAYWVTRHQGTATAITLVFTNDRGEHYWAPYHEG